MSGARTTTPRNDDEPGRRRASGLSDAGHEAVGQALLISIGLVGMLAATRLAAAAMGGIGTVMDALR